MLIVVLAAFPVAIVSAFSAMSFLTSPAARHGMISSASSASASRTGLIIGRWTALLRSPDSAMVAV